MTIIVETATDRRNPIAGRFVPEIGSFRTVLPQFVACFAKNLLLFDLGLAVSFPTIVVPVLRGLQPERNPNEILSFTDEQSSWYGSIAFLAQPIGSMLSGVLTEPMGRRRAMMFVNIPHIIAFLLLHYASSLTEVYIAALLLGLGVGFMEAPVITYVSEISQPAVRGVLLAFANIAAQCGVFTLYLLGSTLLWRSAAAICLVFPLLTVVAIYFIPETPFWLLSRKRDADALKSLQWLRGWVSPQVVEKEYTEIRRYIKQSQRCDDCQQNEAPVCDHKISRWKLWPQLLERSAVRPFVLTMLAFITIQLNGLVAIRPYLVQIFKTFGFPLDPNWASVILGALDIASNTFCVLTVRRVGKRWLFLVSIIGCSAFCFILGFNALSVLPPGTSSFDKNSLNSIEGNYLAMICFLCLAFFAGIGNGIPWMCLSEIFPFKVRGPATGITAACSYLFVFIATKTYLGLERTFAVSGSFIFYGVVGALSFILHFVIFPETEGRTLADIEAFFTDPKRKFYDRRIRETFRTSASNTDGIELHRRGKDNPAVEL